jgi:hypothetical protein
MSTIPLWAAILNHQDKALRVRHDALPGRQKTRRRLGVMLRRQLAGCGPVFTGFAGDIGKTYRTVTGWYHINKPDFAYTAIKLNAPRNTSFLIPNQLNHSVKRTLTVVFLLFTLGLIVLAVVPDRAQCAVLVECEP